MRALLTIASLVVSAWACWLVWAPPAPRHPALVIPLMEALDPDGDGRLDRREFHARALPDAPFALYDLDDSGYIEPNELEALLLQIDPVWLIAAVH